MFTIFWGLAQFFFPQDTENDDLDKLISVRVGKKQTNHSKNPNLTKNMLI